MSQACEYLIREYAPLMMRAGEPLPTATVRRVNGPFRHPIHGHAIARMKRMRENGERIGDIARSCKVAWRTAWKLTAK